MLDLRARTDTHTTPTGGGLPLAGLYERFDAVSKGRAQADGVNFHQIILDRLTANQGLAEAAGWTACALERDGGSGRIRLVGIAPRAAQRSVVPDWTAGVAAEARAGGAPRPALQFAAGPHPKRIVRG